MKKCILVPEDEYLQLKKDASQWKDIQKVYDSLVKERDTLKASHSSLDITFWCDMVDRSPITVHCGKCPYRAAHYGEPSKKSFTRETLIQNMRVTIEDDHIILGDGIRRLVLKIRDSVYNKLKQWFEERDREELKNFGELRYNYWELEQKYQRLVDRVMEYNKKCIFKSCKIEI